MDLLNLHIPISGLHDRCPLSSTSSMLCSQMPNIRCLLASPKKKASIDIIDNSVEFSLFWYKRFTLFSNNIFKV